MEQSLNNELYKLLLVDDEERLLMGLRVVLRRAGFDIQTAKDGNTALTLIRQNCPHLIICDVMMPPPNGFQLKKILSEEEQFASIPFIFLTARTGDADKIAGLNLGADDYITKPFNIDELISRITSILRRQEIEHSKSAKMFDSKLEEIRRTIVANISHELRTPLGVILAGLDLALREKFAGDTSNLDWYLQASLGSAQRMLLVVNNLIVLSDIDMGRINRLRRPIDLRFQFYEPIQRVLAQYEEKHLKVEFMVDKDVSISAPELEFSTAIAHLVDNACKFSPENGKIIIRLSANGCGGCVLRVLDEGPGIPLEYREKVFERYFQIDQGDTRHYGGLGVGLTIARAIVESVGGQIVIQDSPVGCKVSMVYPPLPDNPGKMVSALHAYQAESRRN